MSDTTMDREFRMGVLTVGLAVSSLSLVAWPNSYTMALANTFLVLWVFHLFVYRD